MRSGSVLSAQDYEAIEGRLRSKAFSIINGSPPRINLDLQAELEICNASTASKEPSRGKRRERRSTPTAAAAGSFNLMSSHKEKGRRLNEDLETTQGKLNFIRREFLGNGVVLHHSPQKEPRRGDTA